MIQNAVCHVKAAMGHLKPDQSARNPASEPGWAPPRVRHLKIVPLNPDRDLSVQPPSEDWAALVCRIAERADRDAFGLVFSHFAPRVKSYLIRTGSSDDAAEDLAQEALVTVWRKAALFDPARAAVSTWVFTIARNLRVDALRRHRFDVAGDQSFDFDLLEADQTGVAEHTDATRQARRIRDALDRLPPEQARVLRLSFYDDEPHAHIAAELGLPLGTVKSRIRLAVAHLRKLLEI